MPEFRRDDLTLRYEVRGDPDGVPVLLIAPGGMRSAMERWQGQLWNPMERLSTYRVIAMDQRNAGGSRGPVTAQAGWQTYTEDQLALLDHLGVKDFHVIGMCIGGSYIAGLLRAAPQRVRSAVMFQPIGLHANRQAFFDMFDSWAEAVGPAHPEADSATWSAFRQNMFGGEYLFNGTPEEVSTFTAPVLLFMGNDLYHPEPISRDLAQRLSNSTFVERWKAPELVESTNTTIEGFLSRH